MAIVDLSGGFLFPPPPIEQPNASVAPAKTSITIDAINEKAGTVFRFPQAGTVVGLAWCTANVATGATVDVRLESVDQTTGFPSGTLLAANTNASQVVAAADDNVIFLNTLTSSVVVAQGDEAAIVISEPGSSPGDMQIAAFTNIRNAHPYPLSHNAVTWAKIAGSSLGAMHLAVEYSGGTFVPVEGIWPPMTTVTAEALSTATTPDVSGLYFTLPFTARVRGAWIWMDGDGTNAIRLVETTYNQGAGTGILATALTDPDVRISVNVGIFVLPFPSRVTLTGGTAYRLINEPTSATARTSYYGTTASAAMAEAWPGGSAFVHTSAKDPTQDSDWTQTTTRRPFMGLIIDGVDVSSGGGAGGSFAFMG